MKNLVLKVLSTVLILAGMSALALPLLDMGFTERKHFQCSELIPLTDAFKYLRAGGMENSINWNAWSGNLPVSGWRLEAYIPEVPEMLSSPFGSLSRWVKNDKYRAKLRGVTALPWMLERIKNDPVTAKRVFGDRLHASVLEASEHFQIFGLEVPHSEPTFEEWAMSEPTSKGLVGERDFKVMLETKSNDSIRKYFSRPFDMYGSLKQGWKLRKHLNEISSVEKLESLVPDLSVEWKAVFAAGAWAFTTEDYGVILPRMGHAVAVCLPEEKPEPQTQLDAKEARKSLFDFMVKANSLKFLRCEDILINP